MANLPDLYADPAILVGDDTQPAFTFRNSNAAPGPAVLSEALVVTSTASIDRLELAGTGAGNILAANATVGTQLAFSAPSRASGAFIKFNAGLVSAVSILATTGGVAGTYAIRVVKPDGTFGWIPVYPDGAVTAAAI